MPENNTTTTHQNTDEFETTQNVQTHAGDYDQVTDSGSENQTDSLSPSPKMKEGEKKETKPKKPPLIIQAVRGRKGLYPKIETAMLKKVSRGIAEGRNITVKPDKFIFDLIERGLKDLEREGEN